jgi:hypothetical protein
VVLSGQCAGTALFSRRAAIGDENVDHHDRDQYREGAMYTRLAIISHGRRDMVTAEMLCLARQAGGD